LGERFITERNYKAYSYQSSDVGTTLLELLVAIFIIAVLIAILLPVFGKVRRSGRVVIGMNNQRQIISAVNLYSSDNDGLYPPSVATIGSGDSWNWTEPTVLTAYRKRGEGFNRSVSAYLRCYIKDARVMFCPSAPRRYKYLQQSWDAGDEWDNPETPPAQDPVTGSYCFYWNYIGVLEEQEDCFKGPRSQQGGGRLSDLLVSDYFGYDHWRSRNAFGSCERFRGASVVDETPVSSAYWSGGALEENKGLERLRVELKAGYIDGHVDTYIPSEVAAMKVSLTSDGRTAYSPGFGPGIFYIPIKGLP